MDKSMFTHINGEKIQVIGAKNNKSGNIILDIFKALNQDEIKIFINNHFKYNNNIITDGCSGYNFQIQMIMDINTKSMFMIQEEILMLDNHSTSHIEGVLGKVKLYIATIYNKIPDINYILFLRKDELTYRLRDKSYIEKRN